MFVYYYRSLFMSFKNNMRHDMSNRSCNIVWKYEWRLEAQLVMLYDADKL